jgi:hypothetical protein
MKYIVQYDRPKKKGTAIQRATFFDIRDAMMWERHIRNETNCKNVELVPIFTDV